MDCLKLKNFRTLILPMKKNPGVEKSFALAKERYAEIGVDANRALKILAAIPLSLHCWQGDDVGGFENTGGTQAGD
jgi:L-rhamnose isomerase